MRHAFDFDRNYYSRPFGGFTGGGGYRNSGFQTTEFGYSDGGLFMNTYSVGRESGVSRTIDDINIGMAKFGATLNIFAKLRQDFNRLYENDDQRDYPPAAYDRYNQRGPEGPYPNSFYDGGRPQYRGDAYQRGSYPGQGDNSNGVFSLGNYLNALDASTGQIPWYSMTAQPGASMPWQTMPWAQQFGRQASGNPVGQNGLREQVSPDRTEKINDIQITKFDKAYADQQGDPVKLETYQKFQTVVIMTGRTEFHAPDANGETGKEQRRSALLGTQYREGEAVIERGHRLYKVYTLDGKKYEEYKQDGKIMQTIDGKTVESPEKLRAADAPENWVDVDSNGKPVGSGSTSTSAETKAATAAPAPLTDEQKKEAIKNAASIGVKVNSFDELKPELVKKAKEKKIDNAENMSEQQLLDAMTKKPQQKSNTNPPAPTDDENDVARLVKLQIQYDNKKAKHENTEDLAKQLGELKNKLGVLQSDKGNDHLGKVTDPKYAKLVEIAKLQGLYDCVTHIDPKKDQGTYNYWNNAPVTGPDGKVISGLSHKQDLAKKLGYLKSQAAGTVDEKLNAAPKAKAPDSTQPAATDKSPDPTQPAAGTAQTPVPQSPIESGRLPINNAIQMVDTALSQKAAEVRNIENQIAQLAKKPASEFDKPSESSFRGPKNMQGYSPDVVATLTGLLSQRKAIQKELGVLSRRKNAIVNYRDTEHRPDVTANLKDFDGLGYDHSYHSK